MKVSRLISVFLIVLCVLMLTGCTGKGAPPGASAGVSGSPPEISAAAPSESVSAPDDTPAPGEPAIWTAAPDPSLFSRDGQFITYSGGEYLTGVDVSDYQGEIDWSAAAGGGIDFAILRAGFRGWGSAGTLVEDDYFYKNLDGARSAGLQVGIYFFSQAITPEEAAAEAEFVLNMVSGYDIDLPIFFDWEEIEDEPEARTNGMTEDLRTKCALSFCDRIANEGYAPGVYLSDKSLYGRYNMSSLSGIALWIAQVQNAPDYPYPFSFWQYSYEGNIPGISGNADLNMYFLP